MKKSTKIILISSVTIILVVVALFIPTIVEVVYFHKATSAVTPVEKVAACDQYMSKYPDGKHTSEVLLLKICNCADSQETIKAIDCLIEKNPNSDDRLVYENLKKYLLANPDGTYESFKVSLKN